MPFKLGDQFEYIHSENLPSVYDYLSAKGFQWTKRSSLYYTNSPFSNDRTPSLAVYPSGLFKCYSTGKTGNVITLMRHFGDNYSSLSSVKRTWTPPPPKVTRPWNGIPNKYKNLTKEQYDQVIEYAGSRRITSGFIPGVTYYKEDDKFIKSPPAIMFPHVNEDSVITGAKFRFIEPMNGQRFTSRGALGFYILENLIDSFESPEFWLVESESSSNSLWSYFKDIGKPCVIGSAGSVTSIPKRIPLKYKDMKGNLIIDFDGDESKYNQRLELFKHLELNPIKLVLEKGSDINSLYAKNQISWAENLL